jgi:hypothetical protein
MLEKYKEEFTQRPVKFIIIFIILFVLAFICIYQLKGYFTVVWPNKQAIDNAKKVLVRSQLELQEILNEEHKLLKHRESFMKNSKDFWLKKRDGDAAMNIQKEVNKAAAVTKVILSSVGAARNEKICDGVSLVSISIRGKASLKKTIAFIAEIEKIRPRAYWKSLVLRPDNPRKPKDLVLSGNIQFITITDEEAVELLLKPKEKL